MTLPRILRVAAEAIVAASFFVVAALSHAQSYPGYVFSGPLLPLLLQMPANSWLLASANLYNQVWTPPDLQPLYDGLPMPPSKIIIPWSSFAWDSNRGRMMLWGGGHANYPANDMYLWDVTTLLWQRASYPSEIITDPLLAQIAIDGVDNAPISSHTYDNQLFLPVLDRFITFGGAAFNNGGPFIRHLESDPSQSRLTGPYLFDPTRADGNKVGGTTGSHVKRVAPHPEIVGGQMWQNRDIHKWLAGQPLPGTHVNGCTDHTIEGGRDVVYVASAGRYSTQLHLYRYQLTTLGNPAADQISKVGNYWIGVSGQTTCGYDPSRKLFVRTGNNGAPFAFWDLTNPGPANNDQTVAIDSTIASFQAWMASSGINIQNCGLEFDRTRGTFPLWCGATTVWELFPPPGGNTPAGWTITRRDPPAPAPPGLIDTGVMGKWKYVPFYDVFVGLQNGNNGDVWIYKPVGWVQPNPPGNALPTVSITSPDPGTSVSPGTTVDLNASASDADGSIVRVEYYVNDEKVGQATTPPYAIAIAPILVGSYSVVAVAVDNVGGMRASVPVTFSVTATLTTAVLQRGLAGYAGVSDTYLDQFLPTTPRGASTPLYLTTSSFRPLLRFAIFASEGGPVPDGAVVQSATLALYKHHYDETLTLNAIMKPWVEAEATWNNARTGIPWSTPGAGGIGTDYVGAADATLSVGYNPGWVNFDVTTRVRQWSDGIGTNYGWRMLQTTGGTSTKQFHSSEYATDLSLRPKLTIVYSTGGGPPSNTPPTVSLTSPSSGATITLGESFTLSANAADSDGSVTSVQFFANGASVGVDTTAPYSIVWTPAATGNYSLTAVATDDDTATTTSIPAPVSVNPASSGTTVVLQRGLNGYAGVGDTYLDNYLKTTVRGALATLYQNRINYMPLVRFAIFASEGGPVPNGAFIESATLELYKQYYDDTFRLNALLRPWVESQATWNQATGVPWSVGGAAGGGTDHISTADALVTAGYSPGWVSFNVTTRVQAWSDGSGTNHGWRLSQTSSGSADKQFVSSESSTASLRPKLTVVYSAGGPPANTPPTVSLTSPASGATITLGQSFTFSANAADGDGSVINVEFFANGVSVGQDASAPYSIVWTPVAEGGYSLTAVATDDDGATTTSVAVPVTVNPPASGGTVVLQRGLSGYAGVGDTFLDNYLKTTPRGTLATLWQHVGNYMPLVRFAIFVSEGGPVPDGAIIDSATLSLYKQHYDATFRLNALLKPWLESQATWNSASTGVPWSLPGAAGVGTDYVSAADALVGASFSPGWVNFNVTTRVQAWSDGTAANHGWRLSQTSSGINEKQFHASEFGTTSLRPKLTVQYR
jgi:hypothetical protein